MLHLFGIMKIPIVHKLVKKTTFSVCTCVEVVKHFTSAILLFSYLHAIIITLKMK